jgi:carboxylesterase
MQGCLLVHGLSGTPACVAPLREHLTKAGFHVAAPCLKGHGGTLNDLAKSTWQDWYATVRISYSELKRSCEKVYYAGISLGALLGLKLALDEGWGVNALAVLSTPIVLSNLERLAIPAVRYSPLRFIIKSVKKDWEKSVSDPEGRRVYKETSLPRVPVPCVYQICELQGVILRELQKMENPLLAVHAKKDKVAPPKNVSLLKNKVSSDIFESLILERSEHVVTLDVEKDIIAQKIVEFFLRFN